MLPTIQVGVTKVTRGAWLTQVDEGGGANWGAATAEPAAAKMVKTRAVNLEANIFVEAYEWRVRSGWVLCSLAVNCEDYWMLGQCALPTAFIVVLDRRKIPATGVHTAKPCRVTSLRGVCYWLTYRSNPRLSRRRTCVFQQNILTMTRSTATSLRQAKSPTIYSGLCVCLFRVLCRPFQT